MCDGVGHAIFLRYIGVMSDLMSRRDLIASALCAAFLARPAHAARVPYTLGPNGARITYTFDLMGTATTGTVPVTRADLGVDPQNLTASTADVTADLRRARTGLIFATQALKSAQVLDAARHPFARFRATRVRLGPGGRISNGAEIAGNLTLRGVTRPVTFDAGLFRPPGTAPDDLSRLTVRLRGSLSRTAYGATGYPELVADIVGMDIEADIRAVP